MSNKQNSIEWLANKLILAEPNITEWARLIKQAQQIHKEEIIRAWKNGDNKFDGTSKVFAEKYYNENYNL